MIFRSVLFKLFINFILLRIQFSVAKFVDKVTLRKLVVHYIICAQLFWFIDCLVVFAEIGLRIFERSKTSVCSSHRRFTLSLLKYSEVSKLNRYEAILCPCEVSKKLPQFTIGFPMNQGCFNICLQLLMNAFERNISHSLPISVSLIYHPP